MFGRKEAEPLNGVFAKAWVFEPSLRTSCENVSGFRCGVIRSKLPRNLRRFLKIGKNEEYDIKVGMMVLDGKTESLANLSVETGSARAVFTIRTERVNGEGEQILGTNRSLTVRKSNGDTFGEPEVNAESKPLYVKAVNDLLIMIQGQSHKFSEVDFPSLCRTCPAQIDGLPRTVV